MSTILVPVDFSPSSDNAIDYTIHLAKLRHAKIELVHVYPLPIAAPDMPSEMILSEQIALDARDRIEAWVASLKNSGVMCTATVVAGTPGSEIIYTAEQTHPELIVMGTHGASQKKNRWLGSNSLYVIDRSNTPVLGIPENVSYKPWKRICVATDFDHHEIDAIKELSAWVKAFDAELVLIHINSGNGDEERTNPAYRNSFIETIKSLTGIQSIQYEHIPTHINLVDELREYAVFHKADVLVMLHHIQKGLSRLWHNSLTKEMAQSLPIALLSYPVSRLEVEETG